MNRPRNSLRCRAILPALIAALAALALPSAAYARHSCIANYSTDGRIVRSPLEAELIGDLPGGLSGVLQLPGGLSTILKTRIEDALNGRGWRAPFAQARYDDMIFTLATLKAELGAAFTPELRAAIVEQFTSPVELQETMEPLRDILLSDPERFEALLDRHVGALKYWQQFGLCFQNSPYWFYQGILEEALFDPRAATTTEAMRPYKERMGSIPMRNLGGTDLIIRRSYLPDPLAPRIRYVLPPCERSGEPRDVTLEYDAASSEWTRVKPSISYRGWYARGFSDWSDIDLNRDLHDARPTSPPQFEAARAVLAERFLALQIDLELPVALPAEVELACE